MRQQLADADGVLICTPEYAGALPAALKNLLEWTIGDGGTYDKPVAWINVSGVAAPTGGADAHTSLRKVLEYSGADIVEAACVRVPLSRQAIGANGLVEDPTARRRHRGGAPATRRAHPDARGVSEGALALTERLRLGTGGLDVRPEQVVQFGDGWLSAEG